MVCSSCFVPRDLANTGGIASYVSLGKLMFSAENLSAGAATLFLGGEDDFYDAMPDATAFIAATVGWPPFFVADSPDAARRG